MKRAEVLIVLSIVLAATIVSLGFIFVNRLSAVENYVMREGVGFLLFSVLVCIAVLTRLALARYMLSDNDKLIYSVLLMLVVVVTFQFFGGVEGRLEEVKGATSAGFYVSVYVLVKYGYAVVSFCAVAVAAGIFSGIVISSGK